jgi:hypothetical protein
MYKFIITNVHDATQKKTLFVFGFLIKNHLLMLMLMLMAPFYVCKIVGNHHQKKHFITSLIFMLMFSKKLDKFYSYFKD